MFGFIALTASNVSFQKLENVSMLSVYDIIMGINLFVRQILVHIYTRLGIFVNIYEICDRQYLK